MSLKAGTSTASTSGKPGPPVVKEFTVKLARDIKKKYSVMQFNRGDKIDFSKLSKVVMDRENNQREFKGWDDAMPTHGAGSEFGRERREEARRKKYGIRARVYNPENQPWLMRLPGKPEKKYRGKKAGLITENSSYYLFTQQADGTFHAIPVDSWYMFQQSIKHQTLNAEEAEEEFNRRDKAFNYFSLMVQKRLKDPADTTGKPEEEEKNKKGTSKTKSLTILEDDDYRDLMSSGDSDDSEDDPRGGKKKKPKKKGKAPARPKKKDSGSEAEEESDTGDFEGRELDYLSEKSSDEEAEEIKTDCKGLDEEMQKMEDEEEELAAEEEDKEEGDEEKKKDGDGDAKDGESTKKESSSSGSDSEDSDIDDTKIQSSIFMQKKNTPSKKPSQQKSSSKSSSRSGSRPGTPMGGENGGNKSIENTLSGAAVTLETPNVSTSAKRPGSAEPRPAKKARTESPVPSGSKTPTPEVGLTEDVVRRYLMRKPMTTKDLLYKLNPKKTGLSSEEVVKRVTMILRKLNPEKRKIKDKMYWHIKDDSKPASR